LGKVQHEQILFLEFGSKSDDFSCRIIYAHENSSAFGVEKCNDSLQKDPFGLLVFDWQVVFFVLDMDTFRWKGLTKFEVAFAVDAAKLLLLHVNEGLNNFL
jgi:hypothetical protein